MVIRQHLQTSATSIHPLVESILSTGAISLSDGRRVQATSHIPRDECELIYRRIARSKAARAVEGRMAFGISSLCLCDALTKNAAAQGTTAQLISMDPAQHDGTWQGIGLALTQEAGFGNMVEFHERPSQLVLRELVSKGVRVDLVFIDGWHTFDHTLVDFFFADQLLDPGGVIVLDDVGYPSINAAARFILSNRDYELVEALQQPRPLAGNRLKRAVKRWLGNLARTDHTPGPKDQVVFKQIEFAHSVAIRKRGHDQRRWDHFAAF